MIYLMRHLGGLSHTDTVWANRRGGGVCGGGHTNFPTCPSIAYPCRYFMKFHQLLLEVFLPCSSTNPQRDKAERDVQPESRRIREIDQYLRFIRALERISLSQSITSDPVVLHNARVNKLSLLLLFLFLLKSFKAHMLPANRINRLHCYTNVHVLTADIICLIHV